MPGCSRRQRFADKCRQPSARARRPMRRRAANLGSRLTPRRFSMREADFDEFSAMLEDVVGLYPKGAVTGGQKAMFFRALAAHPIAEVRAGFDAHVKDPQRGRFVPLPADILAQIEGLAAD